MCFVEEASTPSPAGAVQLQGHCWIPPRPTCSPAARQASETETNRGFREAYSRVYEKNSIPGAVSRAGKTHFLFAETENLKPELKSLVSLKF